MNDNQDVVSLFQEVNKTNNGSIYIEIVNVKRPHVGITTKYRIEIRKDTYDAQSYGKISYWNDQWVFIHSINHSSMKTQVPQGTNCFLNDRNSLLEVARKIVEGR